MAEETTPTPSGNVLDTLIASESKIDKILTSAKSILKKHWGILIIIGVGYFFYWALTTDFPKEPEMSAAVQDTTFVAPATTDIIEPEPTSETKTYSDSQYYIGVSETVQYGPYTMKQIDGFVAAGSITINTYMWKEGMTDWTQAKDIEEVNALF